MFREFVLVNFRNIIKSIYDKGLTIAINTPLYCIEINIHCIIKLYGPFLYLIHNTFQSSISQVPVSTQLLPVALEDRESPAEDNPFICEPAYPAILEDLLKRHIETVIYRSLLNSVTGEHAARMTAMDSATNNCDDLIDKKTLERNKARQAAITQEISEIVGGAAAV